MSFGLILLIALAGILTVIVFQSTFDIDRMCIRLSSHDAGNRSRSKAIPSAMQVRLGLPLLGPLKSPLEKKLGDSYRYCRSTHSTTNAGLSRPSTSTVIIHTISIPPSTSLKDCNTNRPRMRDPHGTGPVNRRRLIP